MHYVSKESSNKELIWIRKMISKEKKNKTIKWKKRTKCLLANFNKRDFIQKERSFVFKQKKKCIVNMNAVYMSSFRDTVLNIT